MQAALTRWLLMMDPGLDTLAWAGSVDHYALLLCSPAQHSPVQGAGTRRARQDLCKVEGAFLMPLVCCHESRRGQLEEVPAPASGHQVSRAALLAQRLSEEKLPALGVLLDPL